jgi:hypothetical protein
VFDDIQDGLRTLRNSYRRDYWSAQPSHVEVWAEKDAITGAIQPVTYELGVTMRVSRGFTSTTRVHEIASEFAAISMPVHVYYLGDHDPSGRAIELDLYDRVSKCDGVSFHMERLAILEQDIRRFKLPPLRVKLQDPRAAGFRRTFGNQAVELDALPPDELRRRVREAVESHIDGEAWTRALAVERAEKESIENFVGRWKAGRETPPAEEELIEKTPRMFGVSVADLKLAEEINQADPALFQAVSCGRITLAQAGRKVKKQRKATALSRRLAELGIAGLVSEKEAKRAMALARLPKGIFEALADGKITLTQAKRRAKRRAPHERTGSTPEVKGKSAEQVVS